MRNFRCNPGPRPAPAILLALATSLAALPSLHAQSIAESTATTSVPVPFLVAANSVPEATTNAVPVNSVPPVAANSAPVDESTNSAPLSPASTTSAPGSATDDSTPSPGEMSAPATELVGPPAPGSLSAPAGPPTDGAMPGNNPAVTDITNQPGAAAGLGQRRLPFYFGFDLGEMYDDNILISPNSEKKASFITHASPSIDYQQGDQTSPHMNYLNLYFAPTVSIYHDQYGYNRIDYNGDIYYQYNWTRLSVGFEQKYQHLTDATLDEGALVSRNIYTTKLTADYAYNDDLTLYGTATQAINSYTGFTLNEWDLDTYALYQVAPKLSIGAGPRFSWLDIQDAPNETHQDLLFRLRYVPDQKFVVSFDGGVEYLQYQGNTPSRILPIFDANLTYSPFQDTSLFLLGGRETINSYDLRGDTIDFNTIQVGVSQNFLQMFTATATTGYNNSVYQYTAGTTSSTQRQDNYYFAKGTLDWNPNDWLKFEASYQWSNQNSTFVINTFTDNQIDLQSTVKF